MNLSFFLFSFCFLWVLLVFFLVMAMKGGGLINIMQFFMSNKFVFIYTISVNAIYIFFFTFILCGLRGTNKLYCSWSPLWFRSANMAIKTYDFLRGPEIYRLWLCAMYISDIRHGSKSLFYSNTAVFSYCIRSFTVLHNLIPCWLFLV